MLVDRTIFKCIGPDHCFINRGASFNIILLHLGQVELLWTQDRARSSDSNPTDEWLSGNLVVLHGPETNERSGSTKSSFAMNSNGATIGLTKVVITDLHELFYYVIRRCRSIDEEQIVVGDCLIGEVLFIVFLLVKSYYALDIKLLEDVDVLVWVVSISLVGISFFDWSHKCHELSWDDPVEVAVFDSLVGFILLDVESLEVVPTEFHGVLKALENL